MFYGSNIYIYIYIYRGFKKTDVACFIILIFG